MANSALRGLDLREWIDSFDVYYATDPVLEEHAAVHALTTYGHKNELGEWDILIHPRFKRFEKILVHHEAIENYLRHKGWDYERSHQYALRKDRERFGGTRLYDEMIRALR